MKHSSTPSFELPATRLPVLPRALAFLAGACAVAVILPAPAVSLLGTGGSLQAPDNWRPGPAGASLSYPAAQPAVAASGLEITLTFGAGLSLEQQAVFTTAKQTWEGLLHDYQGSVLSEGPRPNPTILASAVAIDGASGTLAQAGWSESVDQGGFILATAGEMEFDTADLAGMVDSGTFYDVVLHEMAHVLGFGTLWVENGVRILGSGQFIGQNAVNKWKVEFDRPLGTFVPIEQGGGSGTAFSHWNEINGGKVLTGIEQVGTGNDMRNELMTGWLDTPTFISQTTIESFRDIGFAPVPEPATGAVATGVLLFGLLGWRRLAPGSRP